jgi:putative flippase GtrA
VTAKDDYVMIRQQFIRYVAIGLVLNAAFFGLYLLLTWSVMGTQAAMTITFSIGMLLSFIANRAVTFRHSGNRLGALLRFITCYAVLYLANSAALMVFAGRMGIAHQVVQAGAVLTLPLLAFGLQKYWVFAADAGQDMLIAARIDR